MHTVYDDYAKELHESWINGNRKDVINAISCNPSLCARVAGIIRTHSYNSSYDDYTIFLSIIDSMNHLGNSPNEELLANYLAPFGYIASLWHISDVHDIIDDLGLDPVSDEDAFRILQITERNHDSTVGINHDSIECSIRLLHEYR